MTGIYPFKTREVRDLAWACFAPPLIRCAALARDFQVYDCVPQLTPERRLWLETLDRDPRALQGFLAARTSHRLGIYFESLWQFFLAEDPAFELVAHNLPVQTAERTLGEFDCVYFCHHRQRFVHLELAVKYYLHAPAGAPLSGAGGPWLGPDTRDRLDLKLEHLLNRQLRLGERQTAVELLYGLGIESPLKEVAFRGYLFANGHHPSHPAGFDPANPIGEWRTLSQVRQHLDGTHLVLPRLHWLSPAQAEAADPVLAGSELLQALDGHFSAGAYPLLLAGLDAAGAETRRFFVTADDWPRDTSHAATTQRK